MGKIWIPGGGGAGSGSDDCTASKAEVLKGYSAIISDSDDEAVQGTLELTADATDSQVLSGKTYYNTNPKSKRTGSMTNQGAVSIKLNAGEGYTVPSGFHNGGGKVEANSLTSQTPGNAGPGAILAGYNAWVNGNKVPGSMPIQGADVSGTDRAWATNISCWEGAACLGVRNGHYLNGVNWIQGNIPNFYAGNIRKGVNMGGLVGTFEGYVPTATDLYLRGNNIRGWTGSTGTTFDTGQITFDRTTRNYLSVNNLNFTGYNWLNIQGYTDTKANTLKTIRLWLLVNGKNTSLIGYLDLQKYGAGNYTYGFDLSSHQIAGTMRLVFEYMYGAIYRIWLT